MSARRMNNFVIIGMAVDGDKTGETYLFKQVTILGFNP